ncbi:hypothetical protein CEXT_616111, partial [Caerostris extrusa]
SILETVRFELSPPLRRRVILPRDPCFPESSFLLDPRLWPLGVILHESPRTAGCPENPSSASGLQFAWGCFRRPCSEMSEKNNCVQEIQFGCETKTRFKKWHSSGDSEKAVSNEPFDVSLSNENELRSV